VTALRVEVPRKLKPLLYPKRYKGAYGGRGGAKSHFFAEQIILRCYDRPTRVVCIREVQKSIRDSVRQLLIDKIAITRNISLRSGATWKRLRPIPQPKKEAAIAATNLMPHPTGIERH